MQRAGAKSAPHRRQEQASLGVSLSRHWRSYTGMLPFLPHLQPARELPHGTRTVCGLAPRLKTRQSLARAANILKPGESRRYELGLRVISTAPELRDLKKHDGPLTPPQTQA